MTDGRSGIVTLTTDFGTADGFAGAVKGAVLSAGGPGVRLVDVAHDLPPGGIAEAAFALRTAVPSFPSGTVHLAVVDPGVGSGREMLAVEVDGGAAFLVGPDNGVFSYLLDDALRFEAFGIDPSCFPEACRTFQGRDVFGPAAGRIAAGAAPRSFGGRGVQPVRLPRLREAPGARVGRVVQVDRFGNLVTSLPPPEGFPVLELGERGAARRVGCYAELAEGEVGWYVGSLGLVEAAVRNGSAAERLGLGREAPVRFPGGGTA